MSADPLQSVVSANPCHPSLVQLDAPVHMSAKPFGAIYLYVKILQMKFDVKYLDIKIFQVILHLVQRS